MRNLLLRADGDSSLGAGHLMRCLALAEAWQDAGGGVCFALASKVPALEGRLASEEATISYITASAGGPGDAHETALFALGNGVEWVVVDGYGFGAAYQDALRQAGLRVLLVDDPGGADRYAADFVLNPNLHASESLYAAREPHCGLLLGPRYALLRREFRSWRGGSHGIAGRGRKILVTLGASDPANVTPTVIEALRQVKAPDLDVVIVVGPANLHSAALEAIVRKLDFAARLERNPANLPELMASADLAVSAAGSTCWELAYLGLPALVIVCAANQEPVAQSLHQAGAVENLGRAREIMPEAIAAAVRRLLDAPGERARMRERGRRLIDGRGPERVLRRLARPIHFRSVREEDCRQWWEWANDPEVRAASFCSDPIPWDTHVPWFRSRRADPHAVDWMALDGASPAGQVRFDLGDAGDAVMSVSVARAHRGRGLGSAVISAAVDELFRAGLARRVDALVKIGNQPSLRAFEKAGFRRAGVETVNGYEAQRFVRGQQDD